ncbi:hypothetical protein PVAND_001077 [Polypedilum vanderplanki]|uniref:Uncharacterized protein n=1 Tax=Polypedilum vanderplanki TaxID=319348 RepID=A0A9J6BN37_POLVA|nr:hypothetical protein PVAND_001077 [Polypedilum vanderplanki]
MNFYIFLIVGTLIYGTSAGGPGLNGCSSVITSFGPLISSYNSTILSIRDQAINDMQQAYTTNKTEDLKTFSIAANKILKVLDKNLQTEVYNFLQIIPQTFLGVSANDAGKYFVNLVTIEGPLACLDKNIIINIYKDAYIAAANEYVALINK